MSLIENKSPVRTRFLNAVKAEKETDADYVELEPHPSRSAAHLPSCTPVRKARTILVPVDLTASSGNALDFALRLAESWDASIVLLHVVDWMYAEGFLDTPAKRSFRSEVRRRAKEKLDALGKPASNHLVPIRCVVRHGMPEYEILRLAENMNADMIVLERRRRSSLSRLIFGSVTRDVVDVAPCPVVVVPARGVE